MQIVYPTLRGEIAKRGIKKSVIAERAGITERTLYSKLSGLTSFTWEEVCVISETFFPDLDRNTLFAKTNGDT